VNVGIPRTVPFEGNTVTTSIWKSPVAERVRVAGVNVEGDDQADRSVHGGVDKAIYAYASEDYSWWKTELDRDFPPGTFGENITTSEMNVTDAEIGERWRVGTTLLEVSQPRMPCFKLGIRMGDKGFPRRFSIARRPGAYLRIIEPGDVAAGDPVERVSAPGHGVTVGEMAYIYYAEQARASELLLAPQLPDPWREWAVKRSAKAARYPSG
jgi:MOSC domain-containing protein YiiM